MPDWKLIVMILVLAGSNLLVLLIWLLADKWVIATTEISRIEHDGMIDILSAQKCTSEYFTVFVAALLTIQVPHFLLHLCILSSSSSGFTPYIWRFLGF